MYFCEVIKLINVGENPSVDVLIGQFDETADARISASIKNSQLDAVQHQRRAFVALRNLRSTSSKHRQLVKKINYNIAVRKFGSAANPGRKMIQRKTLFRTQHW